MWYQNSSSRLRGIYGKSLYFFTLNQTFLALHSCAHKDIYDYLLRISSSSVTKSAGNCAFLIKFSVEILNRKLHFLRSDLPSPRVLSQRSVTKADTDLH